VSNKVGRNEPCPCGSGKKYKKCCLSKSAEHRENYRTGERFRGRLLALRDGQRQEKGKRLKANIMYKTEDDIDLEIENLISGVLKNVDQSATVFRHAIFDCKHKLYGVRWHHQRFLQTVEETKRKIAERGPGIVGVASERQDPSIIYVFEDFLFQVKSSIELLEAAIKVGLKIPKVKDVKKQQSKCEEVSGKRLLDALRDMKGESLADMLENQWKQWIFDLTKMRNIVAHQSQLKGFSCFVEDAIEQGGAHIITPPKMPSGEFADEYCQQIWTNLLNLHEKVFTELHKNL
jgi:hypothetical protein